MDFLDSTTVAVYSPTELSQALGENSYTYIYLAADITMTGGITVHASKRSLVIDGLYLSVSPEIRTLTDQGGDSGMIIVNSTIDLVFQNLNITGRNYHGMPRVDRNAATVSTVVTYRNVTYTGPQMIWHPNGLARFFDCTIKIVATAWSGSNEVGEIRAVEIGGETTMEHESTASCAVFFFYEGDTSLTILKDAHVTISTSRDFYYEHSPPRFVIEPRARLSLTTQLGMARSSSHHVASLLVDEGATFRYTRTADTGSEAALYLDGAFTVGRGATVHMQSDFPNNRQLVRFSTDSADRGLYLNRPRAFVLYNSGTGSSAAALHFEGLTPFSFTAGQVNHWAVATPTASGAGGFTDLAPGRWHRADWSSFLIRGSAINRTTPPGTTIEETTLEEEEINPNSPLSLLQLQSARVLSVGELPLSLDPVVRQRMRVTGQTDAEAGVLVAYTVEAGARSVITDAGEDGLFIARIEGGEMVVQGSSVTATANIPFLLITLTAPALDDGELRIEYAPALITLVVKPISVEAPLCPRRVPADPVVISDQRIAPDLPAWELFVRVDGPLRTDDGHVLNNTVVFRGSDGSLTTLGQEFVKVYDGGPPYRTDHPDFPGLAVKVIEWDPDRGVLGRVTEPIRARRRYSAGVFWEVRPIGQ